MDDKDLKKLKLVYEDLAGKEMPQYGSSSPISTPVIGTETLRSAYVEVPETDEHEHDDEDEIGKPSYQKLIDNIKDTISDIEQKRKEKQLKEIDLKLGEESFTINEAGFLSGFYKGLTTDTPAETLGSAIGSIKQGIADWYEKNKNRKELIIGSETNPATKCVKEIAILPSSAVIDEKTGVKMLPVGQVVDAYGKTKFKIKLVKIDPSRKATARLDMIVAGADPEFVFVKIRKPAEKNELGGGEQLKWNCIPLAKAKMIKSKESAFKKELENYNIQKDQYDSDYETYEKDYKQWLSTKVGPKPAPPLAPRKPENAYIIEESRYDLIIDATNGSSINKWYLYSSTQGQQADEMGKKQDVLGGGKPPVNTVFDYKGKRYIFAGTAWAEYNPTTPSKAGKYTDSATSAKISSAFFASKKP